MRFGSLFSGVGGFDLGLERAGFETAFMCEADAWKRSVLQAHWPDITIHHDVCELHPNDDERNIDLLVGGFPCQDLSVAGARRGLAGDRSGLAFEFLRIADDIAPRWLLLENVPGLLSSNRGRDMAVLLDTLADLGYGVAWRVLDARFFGVPQRRRRVFIVARRVDARGGAGDAARAALRVVWEGGEGDHTPGWPPREILASLAAGAAREDVGGRSRAVNTLDNENPNVSPTVTAKWGTTGSGGPAGSETQNLVADAVGQVYAESSSSSSALDYVPGMVERSGVVYDRIRKLTELECERLMGFPDLWTAPPGVKVSRGRRVAACGDGVVPWVVYWLGRRIMLVDTGQPSQSHASQA